MVRWILYISAGREPELPSLARSLPTLLHVIDRAERAGGVVVAVDGTVDTSTAAGRFTTQVMGSVAELERGLISDRTKAALAVRKAQGVRLGRRPRWPSSVVDRIVAERAAGATWTAIADGLNADGTPTGQGGSKWFPNTVARIAKRVGLATNTTGFQRVRPGALAGLRVSWTGVQLSSEFPRAWGATGERKGTMTAVSVITGGAGGIGLATAKIVGRDHRVVICDISQDRLDAAVAELTTLGIDATAAVCDITDQKSVADLVDAALSLGALGSLIHTAGVSPSMGSPERIMQINALGTVCVNEAFYRHAQYGFASVNVASMAAYLVPGVFVPKGRFKYALSDETAFVKKMATACKLASAPMRPGLSYSISKSFVIWYCANQAARFGTQGARILSVSPGSVDTDMGRLEEQKGTGAMLRHAALKRFGHPEEVAELLAFCASDKASYVTGIDIPCDGGVTGSVTLRDKLSIARKPS